MNAPLPNPAIRTTCPYCGVGCGVIARPDGAGGAAIEGDPEHPANFGRLCSKGSALGETLGLETRLLHPMLRDGGSALRRASWEEALDRTAEGLAHTIARHGPDSVAFYLSGQLLTEDYYVANKLMKGYIGSANVDTNSRLCMASTVAGHRRAFGSDTVPGSYDDLDQADLLVLVGSNAAWCHPVLFQRMQAARQKRGARLVVIDPRRSATADEADLHLALAPGTDGVLFAGLLVHLAERGHIDGAYVGDHTTGFREALVRCKEIAPDVTSVAAQTGLTPEAVTRFYADWASTERVVTMTSQGVNQSVVGTDKVVAIINCHLATGRIGRPGMGPFSLTGQPNAMGGREVGGLANQLAAHMGFAPEEVDRVGRFWRAPRMANREGLKAVEMFEAIERGEIRALWVMGTNPAVSLPRADAARAALARLDLLVISENVASNDTVAAGAHVLLPAAAWGEKDGTVTNSERRISRQRPFLPRAGEARPDWWIVSQVATGLGHGEAFAYAGPADIFREHAALSAFENNGTRDFELSGFTELDDVAYGRLRPFQWPIRQDGVEVERVFADGRFFTPDRKARFVAVSAPPANGTSAAFPLILNTGRVRDQWHTMTRTGLSPRLARHLPSPKLSIHPGDARLHGVEDGGFARIRSLPGAALLPVEVSASQRPGEVFAPIHWNDETAGGARIGALVHALRDPWSGQPDNKATPVNVEPVRMATVGALVSRARLQLPGCLGWSWAAVENGFTADLASDLDCAEVSASISGGIEGDDRVAYADAAKGVTRLAVLRGDRLEAVLFLKDAGSDGLLPAWSFVRPFWEAERLTALDRLTLLSGQGRDADADSSPVVCACFGVSRDVITGAIGRGAADVEGIGSAVKAGSNCGSCIPELKKLLASELATAG
jgi:assimilatory nitrate reductase catalytic subunit